MEQSRMQTVVVLAVLIAALLGLASWITGFPWRW
jgi:hypothetical protein